MSQIEKIVNTDESIACDKCGQVVSEMFLVDGVVMCEECLRDAGYEQCECCGEWFLKEDMYETHDGYICEDCSCDYTECDECGKYVYSGDVYEVQTRCGWRWTTMYVCDSCLHRGDRYMVCEDCGDWFDSYNVDYDYVNGVGYVCESCRDDHYYRCADCEEWFCEDEIDYCEEDEEYYCHSCMSAHDNANGVIHNYSYKPAPKFLTHYASNGIVYQSTNINDLTFGVELEVDKGNYGERCDAVSEISECTDDVYMKSDGSLDSGFEIVTHPATLQYHMNDFKWRQICQIAKDHGFKSHDARTCGLHVHVGRYQLGDYSTPRRTTIANILLIVYRHYDTLVKFARRTRDQLHWAVRPQIVEPSDGDTEEEARDKAMCADNRNRYQAVNLNNDGTIEFRIFNGTLKRDTIIATIQMVSNICLFAKTHTTSECLKAKWEDITTYTHYDELDAYLRDRGLVTVTAESSDTASEESVRTTLPYTDDDGNPSFAREPRILNDSCVIDDFTEFREQPASYGTAYDPDYDPEFPVGSMVVCTRGMYSDRLAGIVGQVVVEDRWVGANIGIYFPGYNNGHDLCGRLTGDRRDSGWWVDMEDLDLVA